MTNVPTQNDGTNVRTNNELIHSSSTRPQNHILNPQPTYTQHQTRTPQRANETTNDQATPPLSPLHGNQHYYKHWGTGRDLAGDHNTLRIMYNNVNGINTMDNKHQSTLLHQYLHKQNTSIAMLSETNLDYQLQCEEDTV